MVDNAKQPTHIQPLENAGAESYIRAACLHSLCSSQLSAPEVGGAWEKMVLKGEMAAKSKCRKKEESPQLYPIPDGHEASMPQNLYPGPLL